MGMRSALKNKAVRAVVGKKKAKKKTGSNQLNEANRVATQAKKWLLNTGKNELFLIEQNRNLGDTLHLTPIIHHYRLKHPNAAIAFIIAGQYLNAHEHNPHVDKIFTVPALPGKERIKFRKHLMKIEKEGINLIAPSIYPYGEVWKALAWSYPCIADQYIHNSGVKDLKLEGGRKLIVKTTEEDKNWAKTFLTKHSIDPNKACVLEYTSYSQPVAWLAKQWEQYVQRLSKHGIKCISVCGPGENIIKGTVSAKGITWRQTVALMNEVSSMIGCGSGLTMLAAAAEKPPKILELLISPSITMDSCGYANSIRIVNKEPNTVADHLYYKVLNK